MMTAGATSRATRTAPMARRPPGRHPPSLSTSANPVPSSTAASGAKDGNHATKAFGKSQRIKTWNSAMYTTAPATSHTRQSLVNA